MNTFDKSVHKLLLKLDPGDLFRFWDNINLMILIKKVSIPESKFVQCHYLAADSRPGIYIIDGGVLVVKISNDIEK